MATYSYLRVSTVDQDTEKNKLEILKFANSKKLGNVEFIEEQISGKANFKKRLLGVLLDKMQHGDILIVPELSRIARSITQIFEVIEIVKTKGLILYSLKENFYSNDKSITSTVATTIFALVAQVERDLISLRTKEALASQNAQGIRLGRPKGKGKSKLDIHKYDIFNLLELHVPKTIIAKQYNTTLTNLYNFLKRCNETNINT
jgi:DNA invertase Pin-like site-specific DNA recombinase